MEGAYNYDAQVSVQWAFGYGLSYTTFAYSNLKVDKSDFTADDVLTFTVDVKNTGNRIGKESVLLVQQRPRCLPYSRYPPSSRFRKGGTETGRDKDRDTETERLRPCFCRL